ATEYFDNYQRAQLKAILSQVNPNLTPRLRKANTKEVGVQVNPRQDASVQCSLGPRTLLRGCPGPAAPRPRQEEWEQELGSPATTSTRAVRFPRTIAVYSPVASRRLTAFLKEPSPEREWPEGRPQQQDKVAAVEEEPAALREQWAAEAAAFLEQKYGYYHCKACNIRWESAYVWCVQGTNKVGPARIAPARAPRRRPASDPRLPPQVYFRQFCRSCQKSYNPYRVEDITCQVRDSRPAPSPAAPADRRLLPQSCKKTRCICPVKMRHVDPRRPHRQDLCGRCKGKRLSCDSTFSFKYII
ncbi:ZAR1 protein, partial [Chaetops frenatus]|nr:ZAR1 protein [Chaetops frenatus]